MPHDLRSRGRTFQRRFGWVILSSALAGVVLAGQAPTGWRFRVDRSVSASDPDAPGSVKFVTTGSGFHATNPQAAVYWNPAHLAADSYSVKGTFTLVTPSNHTNYYGLVFGGHALEGPAQTYLYFLAAQDGTWLVKRRDGDTLTTTVLPKTSSVAIKKPDSSGQSINALEVRVTPAALEFVVNGTVVNRWLDAARLVKTDGLYGLRVNHFLDVLVDGFATAPLAPDAVLRSDSATVAMTATVERRISSTVFALRSATTSAGDEVLVIAPSLQRPVDRDAQVTVFGEMAPFDPLQMARKIKAETLDVPADVVAKYRGRAVMIATSVLDQKMVDLTQRVPPPMTTDEVALSALMKRISPTFAALGKGADGSNAEDVAKHATSLEQMFAETQVFWQTQQRVDAVAWATEARLQSRAIERAVRSSQWSLVKSAMATLGQQCQSCHASYRDPFADGSFRIRLVGK